MINASNSSRLNPIPGTRDARGGDVERRSFAAREEGIEAPESMANRSMNLIVEAITRRVNVRRQDASR